MKKFAWACRMFESFGISCSPLVPSTTVPRVMKVSAKMATAVKEVIESIRAGRNRWCL